MEVLREEQNCFCKGCTNEDCLMKNKIFKTIFDLLNKWIGKKNG